MSKTVAILGGGVAGMTAAHELVERGFQVTVFEMRKEPGGKARSIGKPHTGMDGRKDLPGEHGFRFFPGFYRHIPDTMKRIPYGKKTVFHNLVATAETQIGRAGKTELFVPAHFPATPQDLLKGFQFFFTEDLGLSPEELRHYVERLLVLLTSCTQRRFTEYEHKNWWSFVGAAERSEAFQKYCADGLTRTCVACKADKMSTRTGGYILLQLLFAMAKPGAQVDRVLNGPTNDVWIEPWLAYLRQRGVDYRLEAEVTEIHSAGGRVTGVTVNVGGAAQRVEADYYIAALPVEVMEKLANAGLTEADARLGRLHKLERAWMNGIQFYLANDVHLVRGHSLYIDSQWSLTSVSQQQFWPHFRLQVKYANGQVGGVLSVDISDWETPGIGGKRGIDCRSQKEIQDEVWSQLQAHLNDQGEAVLEDKNVVDCFLDPAIVLPNPQGVPTNLEPLLINTAGSWKYRPKAKTRLPNFFLAADYVRTHTDLASMEGANEAARQAVNALLKASGVKAKRCKIWPLQEPWIFAPLRWYDRRRFRKRLPHDPRLIRLSLVWFVPIWNLLYICWGVFRFFQNLFHGRLPRRKYPLSPRNPGRGGQSSGRDS